MVEELFQAIDAKDHVLFSSFLSQDCRFKFGNLPEVVGVGKVREFVAGFFESINSLAHTVDESWNIPEGLVCHGKVTYTRKDGSTLTLPFANIFKLDSSGIVEYSIFADTSELYK